MTIKRADVGGHQADFSDAMTRRRPAPVRPGETLRDEFVKSFGLGVYDLADVTKAACSWVNGITGTLRHRFRCHSIAGWEKCARLG